MARLAWVSLNVGTTPSPQIQGMELSSFRGLQLLLDQPQLFDVVVLDGPAEAMGEASLHLRSDRRYHLEIVYLSRPGNDWCAALTDGEIPGDGTAIESAWQQWQERKRLFNRGQAPEQFDHTLLCWLWLRPGSTIKQVRAPGEVELNAQKLVLLELERRLRQDDFPYKGEPIQNLRDARERNWIDGRLKLLNLRALSDGRVAEVLVNQGENVGSGTLLMRIEAHEEPLVWVYLPPKQARQARAGQELEVKMPDGNWLEAIVIDQADLARRLPPGLNGSPGANNLALQVPVRFVEPLPAMWRVNQLPLRVRFPLRWPRLWPR